MGGTEDYWAELNKPGTGGDMQCDVTHMWNLRSDLPDIRSIMVLIRGCGGQWVEGWGKTGQ